MSEAFGCLGEAIHVAKPCEKWCGSGNCPATPWLVAERQAFEKAIDGMSLEIQHSMRASIYGPTNKAVAWEIWLAARACGVPGAGKTGDGTSNEGGA